MIVDVTPISLIHTLVKGNDKARREAGNYKDLEGDYERLLLLIVGCFFLLAGKFQKVSQRWEHLVDFWQIGDKVASLCDYWEIVDLAQNGSRTLSWIEGGVTEKAMSYGCKTFSSLVNFFETLVDFKVLKGMNIHKWKVAGSLVGGIGYTHTFYKDWTEDTSQVGREFEESVRETYRTQHQKQKLCDLTILICILAGKIIGFCSAVHALSGVSRVMQFVSEHKEDLLLAAYATFTAAAIGSTFYELQMKELENQKGKTCQIK